MIDITDFDDPDKAISLILSKAKRNVLDSDNIKYFNAYFSKPQNISLLSIGNSRVIYVVEDSGMYTIIGNRTMLDKISTSIEKYADTWGYDSNIEFSDYSDDKEFTERVAYLLT